MLLSAGAGGARAQPAAGLAADLVLSAIGLLGVPYRYGGDLPSSGFDCSGLVRYVARNALGVQLPRQAEEIGRAGIPVSPPELLPGDLVFFNTLGRPFSHVGLYVGDGRFIHAPAGRGKVRFEDMSQAYWRSRFDGARRLEHLLDAPDAPPRTGPIDQAWLPADDWASKVGP
ncbi:MAG: C40 family peptidase [Burkholderiaceae bacterium]|nr:C40 family peptidase [Burkholderiaceae bacterium]